MNQAMKKELAEWGKTIFFALLIAFLVRSYLFQPYKVQMGSMQPTLHNNDFIMVNKISYRFRTPGRGEIVVFNPPGNTSNIHYIKRIIGLPGETLEIKEGKVFINEVEISENYLLRTDTPGFTGPVSLAEDEYFVLGDHRNNSMDSRDFGAISLDQIHGKTLFVLWPLKDFQVFGQVKYDMPEALIEDVSDEASNAIEESNE
jgi:signal peptidase I